MREDIVKKLQHVIQNDLFLDNVADEINVEDSLQSVVGLDSLAFTELRFQCERRFNVEITDEDFTPENFRCINNLAQLIEGKMVQEAAA